MIEYRCEACENKVVLSDNFCPSCGSLFDNILFDKFQAKFAFPVLRGKGSDKVVLKIKGGTKEVKMASSILKKNGWVEKSTNVFEGSVQSGNRIKLPDVLGKLLNGVKSDIKVPNISLSDIRGVVEKYGGTGKLHTEIANLVANKLGVSASGVTSYGSSYIFLGNIKEGQITIRLADHSVGKGPKIGEILYDVRFDKDSNSDNILKSLMNTLKSAIDRYNKGGVKVFWVNYNDFKSDAV